jgi:hypothetical protein
MENIMKKNLLYLFLTVIFFIALTFQTQAQNYVIQRWVIGSGGCVSLVAPNGDSLSSMLGQTAIFSLWQSPLPDSLHQGFWVPYADSITTGIDDTPLTLSSELVNYPNPFNNLTTVKYTLRGSGVVTLKIYDMIGKLRKVLVNDVQSAGTQEVTWDGKDESGIDCPSGSYSYEMNVKPALMSDNYGAREVTLHNMMVIVR